MLDKCVNEYYYSPFFSLGDPNSRQICTLVSIHRLHSLNKATSNTLLWRAWRTLTFFSVL